MSGGGNLRGAPLFLRPSVVRGLIDGVYAIRRAVVEVPILPIKLVDRPRASEDPRLAKANDNATSFSRLPASDPATLDRAIAGRKRRAEGCEVSQTPLVNGSKAGRHAEEASPHILTAGQAARAARNAEIARGYAAGDPIGAIAAKAGLSKSRCLAIAAAAGVPPRGVGKNRLIPGLDREAVAEVYAGGQDLRTVATYFGISKATVKACVVESGTALRPVGQRSPAYQAKGAPRKAPVTAKAPKTIKSTPGVLSTADLAGGCEGRAAAVTSGDRPGGVRHAPAKARQQHSEVHKRSGFEAMPSRSSAAPRSEQAERPMRMPLPVKGFDSRAEQRAAPEEARAAPAPSIRELAEKLAAKRKEEAAKIDWARVADAHAGKALGAKPAKVPPSEQAPSRDECPRCGIPGWKGCEHWLPCAAAGDPDERRGLSGGRPRQQARPFHRQASGPVGAQDMSARFPDTSTEDHLLRCWLGGMGLAQARFAIQRVIGQDLSKDTIRHQFAVFSHRFAGQ